MCDVEVDLAIMLVLLLVGSWTSGMAYFVCNLWALARRLGSLRKEHENGGQDQEQRYCEALCRRHVV